MSKIRIIILVLGMIGFVGYEVTASCVCDATTTKKCKGKDAAGNKCSGSGKATVGIAVLQQ